MTTAANAAPSRKRPRHVPMSEAKRRAPLRKIERIVRERAGRFEPDTVDLECGHRAKAFGRASARCVSCLEADA